MVLICRLRPLAGVGSPEGKAAAGIHHCLEMHPPRALEVTDRKSILAQEPSGVSTLRVMLAKTGGLLQKTSLPSVGSHPSTAAVSSSLTD